MIHFVIPAAGAATRLRPLSSNTSKIMVRVNGKPCLDYIVESIKSICYNNKSELGEIVIVDGKFDDIREYCAVKHPNIKCVKQESLNGPLDAIAQGFRVLPESENDSVVVWLGDAIILENDLPLGTDFLLTKEVTEQSAWCMWDGNDFYNKPGFKVEDANALVGLYSFSSFNNAKYAFETTYMPENNIVEISSALKVYSYKTEKEYKNIKTNAWYDIGDLRTYYKTCAELLKLKSRVFNNIKYDNELGIIIKTPDYHDEHAIETIANEKSWYSSLSDTQKMFVPQLYNSEYSLSMSYVAGTLLSDMMLYDHLSDSTWEYIIDKLLNIKLKYFNSPCEDIEFIKSFDACSHSMWISKTYERLFVAGLPEEVNEWLNELANKVHLATKPIVGLHGDMHFGNVLYNPYIDKMVLIDPRGKYGSYTGNNGCDIYDFAKLSHDLIHGYNALVSNVPHNETVRDIFVKRLKDNDLDVELITDAGILLLATCIPLHYDDALRQERLRNKVIEYVTNKKYSV